MSEINFEKITEVFSVSFSRGASFLFLAAKMLNVERFPSFMVLLAIFLVIISVFYLKLKPNPNISIPYAKWTPVKLFMVDGLINIFHFHKVGVRFAEHLVQKFGQMFSLNMVLDEVVAVTDVNIIQKLLESTNMDHLSKNKPIYDAVFSVILADGLLAADAEKWKPNRKTIAEGFTYKSLELYLKFMNEAANETGKSASVVASQNVDNTIDYSEMKKILDHHLIKIISKIIMGSECNNLTDEERAKFHLAFHGAKDIIVERLLNPILLIPTIWRFHPKKRQMEACLKIVYEISFKMIDNYRLKDSQANSEKSTSNSNATVDSDELIEIGIKPFESIAEKLIKSGNSNNRIATEICTLLVTGHETLASAFQFLLFALARNPKYQEACRKEIDELLATKDNQSMEGLSMSDLSKLKYLKRCILESLRLYPTVPTFIRRLDSPLDIGNGYKLETGKSLMVMPWVVHRNPEIYPDPETFDPDRFLLENIQKRHSHAFLPFSLGSRNCLGYKIALLEIKIFMVEILRNFYVTTTDKPEDIKIQFDITLKPERPFNIYFTKREI